MTDWPTSADLFWLWAGLAPVALFLWRTLRHGLSEVTSVGFLFIFSLWVGYHLTPWLAFPAGGWSSFLLRPEFVTDGLRFATLSMLAFLIGYLPALLAKSTVPNQYVNLMVPNVQIKWVLIGCSLIIVSLIVLNGGVAELWSSSQGRGVDQWQQRDFTGKILQMVQVFLSPASIVTALLSATMIAQGSLRGSPTKTVVGCMGIFVSSWSLFFKFSRGSGFAFVILSLAFLLVRGRRGAAMAVICLVPALWLSFVGYTQRAEHMPGVGNFLVAAVAPNMQNMRETLRGEGTSDDATAGSIDPTANPLNALDPWTTRAWTRTWAEHDLAEGMLMLLAILQPLPSEFVPWRSRAGDSLSVVLGTVGSTGLTTPALAELHYLFGDGAVLLLAAFGRFAAWIERRRAQKQDLFSLLLWAAFFFGCAVGLHSGLRAMTRALLYVLVIMAGHALAVRMFNRSVSPMFGRSREVSQHGDGGSSPHGDDGPSTTAHGRALFRKPAKTYH